MLPGSIHFCSWHETFKSTNHLLLFFSIITSILFSNSVIWLRLLSSIWTFKGDSKAPFRQKAYLDGCDLWKRLLPIQVQGHLLVLEKKQSWFSIMKFYQKLENMIPASLVLNIDQTLKVRTWFKSDLSTEKYQAFQYQKIHIQTGNYSYPWYHSMKCFFANGVILCRKNSSTYIQKHYSNTDYSLMLLQESWSSFRE